MSVEPVRADRFVDVCGLDELTERQVKLVTGPGYAIALVRMANVIRAFPNACPHRGGPLGLGHLGPRVDAHVPGMPIVDEDDLVLMCPWHAWEFSMADGRCVADGSVRLRVYETEIQDGRVHVALGRGALKRTHEGADAQ